MNNKPTSEVKSRPADVQMQVVVRDKHGNIKYQGPLNMNVVKEKEDGGNAPDSRPHRDS